MRKTSTISRSQRSRNENIIQKLLSSLQSPTCALSTNLVDLYFCTDIYLLYISVQNLVYPQIWDFKNKKRLWTIPLRIIYKIGEICCRLNILELMDGWHHVCFIQHWPRKCYSMLYLEGNTWPNQITVDKASVPCVTSLSAWDVSHVSGIWPADHWSDRIPDWQKPDTCNSNLNWLTSRRDLRFPIFTK